MFNHGDGDDNFTNIDFGWNYANRDGAGAAFRSVDSTISGEAGAFVFYTRNASSNYTLAGKCDGTLTWTGTIVSNGINHISTSNPYAVKVVSPAANVHFGFDWASYNGGGVYFRGSDYYASAEKGNFTLYASKTDGTTNNRSTLTGTPTGVLTWTGTAKISGDHSTAPSSGGLTITGGKQSFAIQIQTNGVTKGTAPSAVVYNGIEFYGNTMTKYQNRLGILEQSVSTANTSSLTMSAYGLATAETTTNCSISCNVDSSGNAYTAAPTPATADNSTKIATTAFVNNRLPYTTGTWTPTLYGESVAGNLTYSVQTGTYLKVGRLVYIHGLIQISDYTTHPTGRAFIGGLPFNVSSYCCAVIIRGSYGQNGCFDKALKGVTDAGGAGLVISTISSSSNVFGNGVFSTSNTDGYNLMLSSSGTIRARIVFGGVYYANS